MHCLSISSHTTITALLFIPWCRLWTDIHPLETRSLPWCILSVCCWCLLFLLVHRSGMLYASYRGIPSQWSRWYTHPTSTPCPLFWYLQPTQSYTLYTHTYTHMQHLYVPYMHTQVLQLWQSASWGDCGCDTGEPCPPEGGRKHRQSQPLLHADGGRCRQPYRLPTENQVTH